MLRPRLHKLDGRRVQRRCVAYRGSVIFKHEEPALADPGQSSRSHEAEPHSTGSKEATAIAVEAAAAPQPERKRELGVFVVGPPRSGKSAVTRVVNLLGVPLGRGVKTVTPSNPSGSWEVGALTAFNEELLVKLGGAWHAPPLLSGPWAQNDELMPLRERARERFHRFHDTQQWVWKDPRNSILLPFWLAALDVRPVVILVCRNPLEVAESVASRDRLSNRLGVVLWERYMRQALVEADGLPLLVARYADVLSAPRAWSSMAREFLSAQGVDCSVARSEEEIARFLDPELRGMALGAEDVATDPHLSDAQRELFVTLERLAPTHERFDLPTLPPETLLTEPLLEERRLTEENAMLAETQAKLSELREKHAETQAKQSELREKLTETQRRLATLETKLSQVNEQRGNAQRRAQEYRKKLDESRKKLKESRHRLDELHRAQEVQE